jgi:pyridoxal phosphate enzyme (YggS family)
VSIRDNLLKLREVLPAGIELVAVSKTHPPEVIAEAYEAGQRVFGENRPQEMYAKWQALPDDIRWHQIGHLQTNKVRLIAPFVEMIHSADSQRLIAAIDREAARAGRVIDILLEIRIASEATKEGWQWGELMEWLEGGEYRGFTNVRFRGVMGVATYTDQETVVKEEFVGLARKYEELKERYFGADFNVLSMGMSDDYRLAIECGSTMVRVGSLIFGKRDYNIV